MTVRGENDDETVLSVRRGAAADSVAAADTVAADDSVAAADPVVEPADTVISRRLRTRKPSAPDAAFIAAAESDAVSTGRTAYSPDAAELSAPYPPRTADPVIASRAANGPTRV